MIGDAKGRASSALRDAARSVRAHATAMTTLLKGDGLIARRYRGTLGNVEGGEPFSMLYVGEEGCAREFELYFQPRAERGQLATLAGAPGAEPPVTLFRGNLVEYSLHRARIEREARDVDLVAQQAFPGAPARDDDVLHCPMIEGILPIAPTLELQLRRVRSRGQRRLMRDIARKNELESRVVTGLAAFEAFRTTMYEPYVRSRFGTWGHIDNPAVLRTLYERRGSVVLVARREAPHDAICGAILLDEGNGTLAYYRNGFVNGASWSAQRMAECTAALELGMLQHAIAGRFERVNFGYTRAFLNDGLLIHKRRLGCHFVPATYSPRFRLRVKPGRRAAIFARAPVLAGIHGPFTAVLGYDVNAPHLPVRTWRAAAKGYAIAMADRPAERSSGLHGAVVWTNESAPISESAYHTALAEVLDLPDGVEWRRDLER
jgi:hypothetical protein